MRQSTDNERACATATDKDMRLPNTSCSSLQRAERVQQADGTYSEHGAMPSSPASALLAATREALRPALLPLGAHRARSEQLDHRELEFLGGDAEPPADLFESLTFVALHIREERIRSSLHVFAGALGAFAVVSIAQAIRQSRAAWRLPDV